MAISLRAEVMPLDSQVVDTHQPRTPERLPPLPQDTQGDPRLDQIQGGVRFRDERVEVLHVEGPLRPPRDGASYLRPGLFEGRRRRARRRSCDGSAGSSPRRDRRALLPPAEESETGGELGDLAQVERGARRGVDTETVVDLPRDARASLFEVMASPPWGQMPGRLPPCLRQEGLVIPDRELRRPRSPADGRHARASSGRRLDQAALVRRGRPAMRGAPVAE